MGFMQPIVTGPESIYVVEDIHGSSYVVPGSVEDLSCDEDGFPILAVNGDATEDPSIVARADQYRPEGNSPAAKVEHAGIQYAARLSAPGYMDCTEWEGPFLSVHEAMVSLSDHFDLCEECGADLDEDYECPSCGAEESEED